MSLIAARPKPNYQK